MTLGGYFETPLDMLLIENDEDTNNEGGNLTYRGYTPGSGDAFASGLEDFTYLFPDEYDSANYKLVPVDERVETVNDKVFTPTSDTEKFTAAVFTALLPLPVAFYWLTDASKGSYSTEAVTRTYVTFDVYKKDGNNWVKVTQREAKVDETWHSNYIVDSKGKLKPVPITPPKGDPFAKTKEDEIFENFAKEYFDKKWEESHTGAPVPNEDVDQELASEVVKDHPGLFNINLYAADIDPDDGKVSYLLLSKIMSTGTGVVRGKPGRELTPGEAYSYDEIKEAVYSRGDLKDVDGKYLSRDKTYTLIKIEPQNITRYFANADTNKITKVRVPVQTKAYFIPKM